MRCATWLLQLFGGAGSVVSMLRFGFGLLPRAMPPTQRIADRG